MEENYRCTNIIRAKAPTFAQKSMLRFLILCGVLSMLTFIFWFVNPDHLGFGLCFWLLTTALLFKLIKMLHEWYHYWDLSIPTRPALAKHYTVDILTTACPGEPREMILRTLHAMINITYPHTTYLCDEGDDPILREECRKLGVIHVTRLDKKNAKAGNINHALQQATGEICIILDPDHVPVPEFIDRVLPYFADEKVGFVQCVQAYGNQSESIIARGAAEQTYHFYGPMMMCMNSYGTVQAIGANCTFRRSALDSIGGHAAGLAEDMHTAMQLHAKGWMSVYIPEMLSRGLVPSTLSSYYKQQLKWSRGTFELLFRTYPKLYKNFTWRQKIHYFTIPLYFLFGLVNFIDITVPLVALALAEVPWEVELDQFAFFFLPLCGLSLLTRIYAQRWLLEPHERGLHLAGGILRTATWWIFLLGFIYSIFNINVPYIPTPKEDARENAWRLSLPNVIVIVLCMLIVVYGLSIDYTPYSMAMAVFGLINAGMLALIVLLSQQKIIDYLQQLIGRLKIPFQAQLRTIHFGSRIQQGVYSLLRNGPVAIFAAFGLLFLSYSSISPATGKKIVKEKNFGGFFTGIDCGPMQRTAQFINVLEHEISFSVFPCQLPLNVYAEDSVEKIFLLKQPQQMPFIQLKAGRRALADLARGAKDSLLINLAQVFKRNSDPVFISISDNETEPADPKTFIAAWQHTFSFFNNAGVSNLTWIYNLNDAQAKNYPGTLFTDWIGVSCINNARAGDKRPESFDHLYLAQRKIIASLEKPVIITRLGTMDTPGQAAWMQAAIKDLPSRFPEIHGLILKNYDYDRSVFQEANIPVSRAALSLPGGDALRKLIVQLKAEPYKHPFPLQLAKLKKSAPYHSPFIMGTPGKYALKGEGNKPFYIKGVAFNTAHDWRDGNMPLTRRQLEADFSRIVAMGANTIRRYDYGIYDRNVLKIADEYNLKVMFGFWFDPAVDYYRDTVRVNEYIDDVEKKIRDYRKYHSILAWSLGNETWGLLKSNFAKPYLVQVRNAYVAMLDRLTKKIHEIDPTRPVLTCMEHVEHQLPGEIVAFRNGAPEIDIIGINSYYKEQIARLNNIAYSNDSLRPYLITEFGPRGYWDTLRSKTVDGLLMEDSETEKANWYCEQWNDYVSAYKGYNLGGFVYCWHDRMEGSCTWFGLTDYRGRVKPNYYALYNLWTGRNHKLLPDYKIKITDKILAGKVVGVYAISDVPVPDVKFEWSLRKENYLDKIDNIRTAANSSVIALTLPDVPGIYRLYVYVTDHTGNVTTNSLPIKIE